MNRKILVLLILIGIFAVIAVSGYAVVSGVFETESEIDSEVSEVVSEEVSEEVSETESETIVKDPTEGVDTEVPETPDTTEVEGNPEDKFDDNGVPREESTYLDDDYDTIANFYDICPGVDDFSSECETDAYDQDPVEDVETEEVETDQAETVTTKDEYDNNGDLRTESKYLDDDLDTVANFYDICPGVDDFSSDCATDAYNK